MTTPRIHVALLATLVFVVAAPVARAQNISLPAAPQLDRAVVSLPGGRIAGRTQVLVDGSLLGAAVGRSVRAIELHRAVALGAALRGGSAQLRLDLGIAPHPSHRAFPHFGGNLTANDPSRVNVFDGELDLPASAGVVGAAPGFWDPADTVTLQLDTPYVYRGGTLCLDFVGRPVLGRESGWFFAGSGEPIAGHVSRSGVGCGSMQRFTVHPRELVVGSTARLLCDGPPNVGAGLYLLGVRMRSFAVGASGLAAPGCTLEVFPFDVIPVEFETLRHGPGHVDSVSRAAFQIPRNPGILGASISAQCVALSTPLEVSEAITMTVAPQVPGLGMSMVYARTRGGQTPQVGVVSTTRAPWLRLRFAN